MRPLILLGVVATCIGCATKPVPYVVEIHSDTAWIGRFSGVMQHGVGDKRVPLTEGPPYCYTLEFQMGASGDYIQARIIHGTVRTAWRENRLSSSGVATPITDCWEDHDTAGN